MNRFFFLFGNLLGAVNSRIGIRLLAIVALIFAALCIFASFFLVGTTEVQGNGPAITPGELIVYLSPRLSSDEVESLYLQIREMPETRNINYHFAEEMGLDRAGGLFVIEAQNSAAAASLETAVSTIVGITGIDSATQVHSASVSMSTVIRLVLLGVLVVTIAATLIVARRVFSLLLDSFASEIRLLRVAGTPEQVIQPPIIALGVLCGIIASMLLIVVVYLLHFLAISHPQATIRAASGLLMPGRVLMVSLVGALIGVVLGGLIGLLGASLTGSPRFQNYS